MLKKTQSVDRYWRDDEPQQFMKYGKRMDIHEFNMTHP